MYFEMNFAEKAGRNQNIYKSPANQKKNKPNLFGSTNY